MTSRPVFFILRLEPIKGVDHTRALRGLRWLLKVMLRQFGIRCVEIREEGYDGAADFEGSVNECYRAIRERVAAGGKPWTPKS